MKPDIKKTDTNSLTLKEKIGQLFFVGIKGTELDETTAPILSDIKPGGVCLFARNIKEAEQTRKLLDDIRAVSRVEPFLSLDQEGGLVDRLRRIVTPMPAASEFTRVEDVKKLGQIIAETISILGFNLDFAPVVDVVNTVRSNYNNGLRSRTFGETEGVVSLAGVFMSELQVKGILTSLKHFPGLGASQADSHEELPVVSISDQEINDIDLYPYRHFLAQRCVDTVMVAHATYPNTALQLKDETGRDIPSSLSRRIVTGLLRDEMGFEGVVITDDLEMGAIVRNFGMAEACTRAIDAGVDMLAICAGEAHIREGHAAIVNSIENGTISEERIDRSVGRVLDLKARLVQPLAFDISRVAELSIEIEDLKHSLK